jgi:hypothetical protein
MFLFDFLYKIKHIVECIVKPIKRNLCFAIPLSGKYSHNIEMSCA